MNVISRPAIREAQQRYADAAGWLENWWQVAKLAQWQSLHDVRATYPAADQVGRCLVFNAHGNRYRFIVGLSYATEERGGTLFVKAFLTHAEYTTGQWKGDC
ncbi:MAG: type II toxin-antitoxin system HigB family toxin [Candidatus Nealsonbacteria bacterium]|nr:type II toxin-antitoxin system HigB family toxin [Candidatus Nealsonbacteria bacterium]